MNQAVVGAKNKQANKSNMAQQVGERPKGEHSREAAPGSGNTVIPDSGQHLRLLILKTTLPTLRKDCQKV